MWLLAELFLTVGCFMALCKELAVHMGLVLPVSCMALHDSGNSSPSLAVCCGVPGMACPHCIWLCEMCLHVWYRGFGFWCWCTEVSTWRTFCYYHAQVKTARKKTENQPMWICFFPVSCGSEFLPCSWLCFPDPVCPVFVHVSFVASCFMLVLFLFLCLAADSLPVSCPRCWSPCCQKAEA